MKQVFLNDNTLFYFFTIESILYCQTLLHLYSAALKLPFLNRNNNKTTLELVHKLKIGKRKSNMALTQLSLTLHYNRRIYYYQHYIHI